jgi:3-mercaptopyruvate sulfurtransferase SseA
VRPLLGGWNAWVQAGGATEPPDAPATTLPKPHVATAKASKPAPKRKTAHRRKP